MYIELVKEILVIDIKTGETNKAKRGYRIHKSEMITMEKDKNGIFRKRSML